MWHPNQTAAQILAIGDNGRILFADVPAAASAAETGLAGCNASASQLPTGMAYVQCNGLVTALAFSADGGKLAAVSGQNKVRPVLHHSSYLQCCLTISGTRLLAAQCCFICSLNDPSHQSLCYLFYHVLVGRSSNFIKSIVEEKSILEA